MSEIAPWTRLFLISLALFVACKWLTYRRATHRLEGVTLPRLLSYWLLWPGMDADVARPFVFQPLARRVGPSRAAAATFLFSGLFHELTFSVPAAGGFGGPTAYFLLQLVGVRVERSAVGARLGLGQGWRGRVFCWAVAGGPACAVFHRPLLDNVVFPWLVAMRLL